ncbi:MAG: ABC transporter permease, partial [Burkholderiaceae bacterium]|nr:ABC transporter permease [Burkholderiaceae bacterium]
MTAPRSAIGAATRWLPFELLVALRFLREGRMQSVLILAGVTGGVAVIIFLTQLINQLQGTIIDRVLGSQAHIVIRPPDDLTRIPPPPAEESAVAENPNAASANDQKDTENATTRIVQPRAQRLRPVDQWEQAAALAADTPGVLAVSPLVTGPAFAVRGTSNKSVVLMGVVPEAYGRIVKMDGYMTQGRFAVQGTQTLIGTELAKDLGLAVGDKLRVTTASGRAETLHISGLFDTGNRDLNRRWVFVTLKLAQTLLDVPGGVSQIDLTVTDLFGAEAVARQLQGRTGQTVESWMQTNSGLLTALANQSVSNNLIRSFVVIIVALGISSVLVVSVVQKQREIGILRAMGAGRQRIMAVFLL